MIKHLKSRLKYPLILFFGNPIVAKFLEWYGYIYESKIQYLMENGWYKSIRLNSSVDQNEIPIPWITYPAIDFLSARIKPTFSVFEYGCGNSGFWWSERVSQVFSVEHDPYWYNIVHSKLKPNMHIMHKLLEKNAEYENCCTVPGLKFEIIIIDGRKRVKAMISSVKSLAENGVIILDNSDRSKYEEGIQYLLQIGFKKVEFWGMCPMVGFKTCTSIFFRQSNCLEL